MKLRIFIRKMSSVPIKQIGLVGICEDRNSSFIRGPAKAPPLIRQALHSDAFNPYCEREVLVLPAIRDFGDVSPLSRDHDSIVKAVEPLIDDIFHHKLKPMVLGGDHSITFSVLKSIAKHIREPITIVHFDAHPDIYDDFEGNPSSHASPFARILEHGLCKQLISMGIRCSTPELRAQCDRFGVKVMHARDFPLKGSDVSSFLRPFISPTDLVYLSVDLDVLDPGCAPGVSHREGGGLSTRQLIDSIQHLPGRLIGADLVEYNPDMDIQGVTAAVAGKVTKEIMSQLLQT